MAAYRLNLKYVYTFYSFDEILMEDVYDEHQNIEEKPHRFTLMHQEDSTFIISELREDFAGKYVILTFPNKDNVVIHEGEACELEYDEFFDAMGDNNHNVYVGTLTLEKFTE